MDTNTVRTQLEEVRGELARVDAVREVLVNLVKGYEGWLRLNDPKSRIITQPSLIPADSANGKGPPRVKGTISVRRAVLKVLQDAHGEPLRSEEIWRRAHDLGADTTSLRPESLVDLSLVSLRKRHHEIRKVAARTYQWLNGTDG